MEKIILVNAVKTLSQTSSSEINLDGKVVKIAITDGQPVQANQLVLAKDKTTAITANPLENTRVVAELGESRTKAVVWSSGASALVRQSAFIRISTPVATRGARRRQVLLLSETLREQRNGSRYNALPRKPPQRTDAPTHGRTRSNCCASFPGSHASGVFPQLKHSCVERGKKKPLSFKLYPYAIRVQKNFCKFTINALKRLLVEQKTVEWRICERSLWQVVHRFGRSLLIVPQDASLVLLLIRLQQLADFINKRSRCKSNLMLMVLA
jgi:hypothetical protein